jgi:phospholipid/cholesterol/gamma-HCH transport system ATP-binding protein
MELRIIRVGMKQETQIGIKSIHKSFGSNHVLNGISLDIKKGSSLVIIGPSGAGKTVLLKTIIGLLNPDRGSILIDGAETTNISNKQRFNIMQKCGFLFQNGGLFDSLTIEENIIFFAARAFDLSKWDKRELATKKLAAVKLPERVLNLYPSELSGGMQKRVGIARAICADPEILFFDDPTGGLDPILSSIISELIVSIRDDNDPTIITITHDMSVAYKIADELALIHMGKLLWNGLKEEMKTKSNPYLHQFVNGLTRREMKLEVVDL